MKLKEIKHLSGKIVVKTGLHIGAGNDKIEIGGIDSPIVKHPLTNEPYIPGSSIKGKMRSLIEWKLGKVLESNGKPCSCGKADCEVCRVFGCGNSDKSDSNKGPTRIVVRDAKLTKEFSKRFFNGESISEEKSENNIDRITAKATPRFIERVVPGVKFDFEIDYKVIDIDDNGETDEKFFDSVVIEGLKMLKNDYLGGGGSRGNGQIDFEDVTVNGEKKDI